MSMIFSLYNNLPVGIFVINSKYEILFWNKMMEHFTKKTSEEITGKNLLKLFPHLDKRMYRFRIDQIFAGGTPAIFSSQLHKYIIPCKLPNGKYRTQHTTVSRINIEDGQSCNAVFSVQDITDEARRIDEYKMMRKQALDEIEKRNEIENKLRESNATKDKFFSIISHDLKNPFITLLGFSEMMIMDYDDFSSEEIKSYINDMYKVAKSTYNLLEDLLLWSRSQKDSLNLNKELLPLGKCVEQTFSTLSNMARRKHITLINNVLEEQNIYADEETIKTVIRNLISNAIKFTDQNGTIKISATDDENETMVSVKDNGVGIEEHRLEEIFNLGTNTSTEGTQNEKGTGLGLVLCHEFVEKHGGRVWAESKVGQGSQFNFTLPRAKTD